MSPACLAAVLALSAWALAVSLVDVATLRIPRSLQLLGAPVGAGVLVAASGAAGSLAPLRAAAVGALVLTAFYLAVRVLAASRLGGGDLRLAPVVGAAGGIAGTGGLVVVLIAPFVVSAVWGLARRHTRTGGAVPHGPGMVWSACACAFAALAAPTG